MKRYQPFRMIWAARLLIGAVLFFNLQCAIVFLLWPGAYAPAFELSGAGGSAAVQGMGLLFVMWNIPYLLALLDPLRYRTSLAETVCMQAIGAGGETLIGLFLPPGHVVLVSSLQRFITFDSGGLVCLLVAWFLVRRCLAQKNG